MYSIPDAAKELEVTEAYIRMMIRQGIIETQMLPQREGSKVLKHFITDEELAAFAQRDGKRAPRRKDGRVKCCMYATLEEVDLIKELLYSTHDDRLMIVAQTLSTSKGGPHEPWIPPSARKSSGE